MRKTLLTLAALSGFALAHVSSAEEMVALTSGNRLLFFDHATPGTITRSVNVTGLGDGEILVGIDYRPATGGLYALGASRLYLINGTTGAATQVGGNGVFTLNGARFGFDFNPTVDRIRVTSNTGQNLRLNPNDGGLAATDGTLAYAAGDRNAGVTPSVVSSAYTNSFAGAAATVLYNIDSGTGALVIQNPPNIGTLVTVGNLGVVFGNNVGFDISGTSGRAFAALTVADVPGLYTIDLLTGAATLIGEIGTAATRGAGLVTDLAAFTPTRVVNLSARGRVGAGNDVLIGGFVNRGRTTSRVIFRALGPSLVNAGVPDALPDPTITIYDSAGAVVASNDDFAGAPDGGAAVTTAGLAPTNAAEAALQVSLAPGAYTAVVRGKGAATGVALVEIYELP